MTNTTDVERELHKTRSYDIIVQRTVDDLVNAAKEPQEKADALTKLLNDLPGQIEAYRDAERLYDESRSRSTAAVNERTRTGREVLVSQLAIARFINGLGVQT